MESCCPSSNIQQGITGEASQETVREYYAKRLQKSEDCQTGVNCLIDTSTPKHIKEALAEVHEEVSSKYYGCGRVIPEALEGCSVLDLGCGTGRDCYAVSKLVGPSGRVVGIDMTEEQLAVARKHITYHTEKFGYSKPNVEFKFGYIEKLKEAGLDGNTFDVVISNCVVNLSFDKDAVLREVYRVLKEGGEFYFSDVYSDTFLPEGVKKDPVLYGECITGALHWRELHQMACEIGFTSPLLVSAKMVDVSKFQEVLGDAKFVSVTYRLFKPPATRLQVSGVMYKGGVKGFEDEIQFDHKIKFHKDKETVVDSELASTLAVSRFSPFFKIRPRLEGQPPKRSSNVEEPLNPFQFVHDQPPAPTKQCCQ